MEPIAKCHCCRPGYDLWKPQRSVTYMIVWMHSINFRLKWHCTLHLQIVHTWYYLRYIQNDSACRCFEHGGLACLTMMNLSALSIAAKFDPAFDILLNELTTCITVRRKVPPFDNWFRTSSTTVLSTRFWQLFWTHLTIVLDEFWVCLIILSTLEFHIQFYKAMHLKLIHLS